MLSRFRYTPISTLKLH